MKLGEGIKPGQKNVLPEWEERARLKHKTYLQNSGLILLQCLMMWAAIFRSPYHLQWYMYVLAGVFTAFLFGVIGRSAFSYWKKYINGNKA